MPILQYKVCCFLILDTYGENFNKASLKKGKNTDSPAAITALTHRNISIVSVSYHFQVLHGPFFQRLFHRKSFKNLERFADRFAQGCLKRKPKHLFQAIRLN